MPLKINNLTVKKTNPTVGIEVEIENMSGTRGPSGWATVPDGSLRDGGIEYVTRHPLRRDEALDKLNMLQSVMDNNEPRTSIRCSIHTHIEVASMNSNERQRFLLLWCFFERTIYRISGAKRIHNPYCRSSANVLAYELNFRQDVSNLSSSWSKYTGFNLATYNQIGTFEARTLEGTTDMSRVHNYLEIMCTLRDISCSVTNLDLHKLIYLTPDRLFDAVIGNSEHNEDAHQFKDNDIFEGVSLATSAISLSFANNDTALVKVPDKLQQAYGFLPPQARKGYLRMLFSQQRLGSLEEVITASPTRTSSDLYIDARCFQRQGLESLITARSESSRTRRMEAWINHKELYSASVSDMRRVIDHGPMREDVQYSSLNKDQKCELWYHELCKLADAEQISVSDIFAGREWSTNVIAVRNHNER